MDTAALFALLDQELEQLFPRMVAIRRHLHRHPEPSGQEWETTRYVAEILADEGLHVTLGPEQRGLWAQLPQAPQQGLLVLRADMDALYIHDAKRVEYASQRQGVMHACGHDAHTAMLVGTALALTRLATRGVDIPCRWRAVFQPEEETSQGAQRMIQAGALDGAVAAVAAHMDPTRRCGTVGLRPGAITAACDTLEFVIRGRGGHAARPHEAADPIAAAAQLISTLYLFVPRATDSHEAVVLTIGQISGGQNPNVIPEEVRLGGTLRTLREQVRENTLQHIQKLVQGLAQTSSTRIEFRTAGGSPAVVNDTALTRLVQRAAQDALGAENVELIPRPSMGSEDFAFFVQRVPGVLFRVGSRQAGRPITHLHSAEFDIDEQALLHGARVLARTAVLVAENPPRPSSEPDQKQSRSP